MMSRTLQQHGVTLVELLVSLVLGIAVISILVAVYASGSAGRNQAQAINNMNEDAQIALEVISQELRRAGYNPKRTSASTPLVNNLFTTGFLGACDTGFDTGQKIYFGTPVCVATGSNSAFAVAYEGDAYTGKTTSPSANVFNLIDCAGIGVAVTTGNTFYSMRSVLSIGPGANNKNALQCTGSTNTQILAENIESMTLSFALTDPKNSTSNQVMGYQSATAINTLNNTAFTDANNQSIPIATRWNMVAAVRVCIVVVSERAVLGDVMNSGTVNASYWGCDATDGTPPSSPTNITDGHLRRAYRTTVILRNLGNGGVGYVNP
jgi:type IV pilus assembly protein PilW